MTVKIKAHSDADVFGTCELCGNILMCIDSRRRENYRYRRYRCSRRKCDYRITTKEVTVETWKTMLINGTDPMTVKTFVEKKSLMVQNNP